MFTRHRAAVRPPTEGPWLTADVEAMIDRLRALSVHDVELARLLDESEPHFRPKPRPSPWPVTGTEFDVS